MSILGFVGSRGTSLAKQLEALAHELHLPLHLCHTPEQALQLLSGGGAECWLLVAKLGTSSECACWPLLEHCRGHLRHVFSIVLSTTAANDPRLRLRCFDAGARMVSGTWPPVDAAVRLVAAQRAASQLPTRAPTGLLPSAGPAGTAGNAPGDSGGQPPLFACPDCGVQLTRDALVAHHQLYHVCEPQSLHRCPICGAAPSRSLLRHLHDEHGGVPDAPRPCGLRAFSWVVVRNPADGRFLLVNERGEACGGRPLYWLPAGGVDAGERLVDAAVRETLEEGGVAVRVTGVLRFMVEPEGRAEIPTLRVVFLAEPDPARYPDGQHPEPKALPDFESAGALWVSVEQLQQLKPGDYRCPDPPELFPRVANGTMRAYPVNTPEFHALEVLASRLTACHSRPSEGDVAEFQAVWQQMRHAYPRELFWH